MDLTPQLLHDVEFREAKRGGYNTHDVDEFLEKLAVGLERQNAAVQEARQRIEAAEARAAEAERLAERNASDSSTSQETLQRTLVLAQRTADAAIREAEEQAAAALSSAQAEAERLVTEAQEQAARARADADAEAEQAHQATRARLLGEMRDLEKARDRLREDVVILERHLDEQRERVRVAVDELQRMLSDPESLYEVPAPVVSDTVAPVARATGSTMADDSWEEADDDLDVDEPYTQPIDVADSLNADDDAYLSELRKAMTDDTPLGPRDDFIDDALFDAAGAQERSRFGRRRSN